jgi:carbamoyl-phosphate synthase small subunit
MSVAQPLVKPPPSKPVDDRPGGIHALSEAASNPEQRKPFMWTIAKRMTINDVPEPAQRAAAAAVSPEIWRDPPVTAVLVLASGAVIRGQGLGAIGQAPGEVCFNTAMTGYEEILTDPSYAGQIVTFTFPHVGNVGANPDDVETSNLSSQAGVRGCVLRASVTAPSSYRAVQRLDAWLKERGVIGLTGVDTRALTASVRDNGMPNGVIAHNPDGEFDLEALKAAARRWPGVEGMDLAREVTCAESYRWEGAGWSWRGGFGRANGGRFHVVAIDYGVKRNILRCLVNAGCSVTVAPAGVSAEEVLALEPDGVFLSNGPGDPAATGVYAAPVIRKLVDTGLPVFGICLGHQMLALALGGHTRKMPQGHHGANHPVKDFATGKVEITSMNHGFTVDRESLPENLEETHVSLFDGTNCGLKVKGRPVFSVQYHPEASPGPQDSHYLFTRFVNYMREARQEAPVDERALQGC